MSAAQTIIGIAYDFDQTLSPGYMTDEVLFPHYGISPEQFWRKSHALVDEQGYDSELAYLKTLLDCLTPDRPTNAELRTLGAKLRFNPGLPAMFNELEQILRPEHRALGVRLEHYIISSGLKELLEGSAVREHVRAVFGSEFAEDREGHISFPKRVIGHTTKTQFLFRINKGKEAVTESINEHMPEAERPIPFQNIIYVGDGMTDVPSMALTKKNGGHTIAVYDDKKAREKGICVKLLEAGRVDFVAEADYRRGSKLARRVELLLDAIVADIAYRREAWECRAEHRARP